MGKGIQVCQGIHCLILTHSVDGDSGKLRSVICNTNMLVLDKTFEKTHYGEMRWYSLHEMKGIQGQFKTTPRPCNVDV